MIEGLIGGMVAGMAYGIIGYAKNKNYIAFDWKQFAITVIGSAVVGAYAQYSGLTMDIASASAMGVVITQASKKVFNIVYEKLEEMGWF